MTKSDGIYLDHNATCRLRQEALEAMLPWLKSVGNASSIHQAGRRARQAIEASREQIAELIGCSPNELIFTSGATEANNQALRSDPHRGLVVSRIEHPSVLATAEAIHSAGRPLELVWPTRDGVISSDAVEYSRDRLTGAALVSVMLANNETGVINDIASIGNSRATGDLIHTDATQAIGRIPVNVNSLNVDFLSMSAHKFGGPQGVGALFARRDAPRAAFMTGGSHERGLRAGTQNVAGIVGMGTAAEMARKELSLASTKMHELRRIFEESLLKLAHSASIFGIAAQRLPNTSLVAFPDTEADAVISGVPQLAISHGSACAAGALEPSHVLRAMRVPDNVSDSAIRVSFGIENSVDEAVEAARMLATSAARVRSLALPIPGGIA